MPTLRITQTGTGAGHHHVSIVFRDDAGTELAAQAELDFTLTSADQERLRWYLGVRPANRVAVSAVGRRPARGRLRL